MNTLTFILLLTTLSICLASQTRLPIEPRSDEATARPPIQPRMHPARASTKGPPNPEETHNNSGGMEFFEGDELLTDKQKQAMKFGKITNRADDRPDDDDLNRVKNGLIDPNSRWPNLQMPYTIDGGYSSSQRNTILSAINGLNNLLNGCVQLKQRSNEANYVRIFSDSGCYSFVGRVGGEQRLSLMKPGQGTCLINGIIQHELLHALGLFHEQSRSDRDTYVRINTQNIQPGTEGNFNKFSANVVSHFGQPYNYGSVMHYGAFAFSSNGQPTVVPTDSSVPLSALGQRQGAVATDINKIRSMYGCSSSGTTTPTTPTTPTIPTTPTTPTTPATTTTQAPATTTQAPATTTTQAPVTTPSNCTGCCTASGPAAGQQCVFPFRFRGQSFNQCTLVGNNPGETEPWCSTAVNANGFHIGGQGNWGFCSAGCVASTTSAPVTTTVAVNNCAPGNNDVSCCTATSPCAAGEGDCDNDSHCQGALVCGTNNCREFDSTARPWLDCCDVCSDIWNQNWCQRLKNRGRCNRQYVRARCQKTCGVC